MLFLIHLINYFIKLRIWLRLLWYVTFGIESNPTSYRFLSDVLRVPTFLWISLYHKALLLRNYCNYCIYFYVPHRHLFLWVFIYNFAVLYSNRFYVLWLSSPILWLSSPILQIMRPIFIKMELSLNALFNSYWSFASFVLSKPLPHMSFSLGEVRWRTLLPSQFFFQRTLLSHNRPVKT